MLSRNSTRTRVNPTGAIRLSATLALGVAAVGGLAGCSAATASAPTSEAPAAAAAGSGPSSSATAPSTEANSAGKDGTYTEKGDYQTPGGPETLTTTLTVAGGHVKKVVVSGTGHTPNAKHYQGAFASGVSAAVIGKPLDTLKVGAVSGSSLTPQGFNAAVEKIRADAR